jgi:hypothetical protein
MCSSGTTPVSPIVMTGVDPINDDEGVFMDAQPVSTRNGTNNNPFTAIFIVTPF